MFPVLLNASFQKSWARPWGKNHEVDLNQYTLNSFYLPSLFGAVRVLALHVFRLLSTTMRTRNRIFKNERLKFFAMHESSSWGFKKEKPWNIVRLAVECGVLLNWRVLRRLKKLMLLKYPWSKLYWLKRAEKQEQWH